MGNYIVGAMLLAAVLLALRSALKHFRGEGGCCGGGGEPKGRRKKLQGPVVAEKVLHIEGMRCENCKNRVERLLNQLEGAAAKVDLKKNIAVVSMSREISDEEWKAAVEAGGYKVTGIELRRQG